MGISVGVATCYTALTSATHFLAQHACLILSPDDVYYYSCVKEEIE